MPRLVALLAPVAVAACLAACAPYDPNYPAVAVTTPPPAYVPAQPYAQPYAAAPAYGAPYAPPSAAPLPAYVGQGPSGYPDQAYPAPSAAPLPAYVGQGPSGYPGQAYAAPSAAPLPAYVGQGPSGYPGQAYAADPRAGDPYCREAYANAADAQRTAAITGNPVDAGRAARTDSFYRRDC